MKPVPKYSIWEAMSAALNVGMTALNEVRELARQPGPQGEKGEEGRLPLVKDWEDRIYREREVVVHRGSTYQAGKETSKEPPHSDWTCLARSGNDGLDIEVEGTYDPARTYRRLSLVALNGGSFISRKDGPGQCPGPDWQLLASQGKRGKEGERGLRGEGGPQGVAGSVKEMEITKDGVLLLTNSDGSIVTCDLHPVLSRMV